MLENSIYEKLSICKLPGIQNCLERILDEASKNNWSHAEFLIALINEEILARENNRFTRLYKRANFPTLKTLDEFSFSQSPFLRKKEILELATCEFIDEHKNLICIGSPGTGKTHISTSLGVEACKLGKTVQFYTAASLGNKLIEMQDNLQLSKFIDKLKKVDLLIIDELGYVELSNATTQLMFQIFSERYEKGSIILSTNLEFQEWPKVFHDERMTTAIIDRLIHNCKIITFNGESYRYKTQRDTLSKTS